MLIEHGIKFLPVLSVKILTELHKTGHFKNIDEMFAYLQGMKFKKSSKTT
jgi:hypothetical protein